VRAWVMQMRCWVLARSTKLVVSGDGEPRGGITSGLHDMLAFTRAEGAERVFAWFNQADACCVRACPMQS